MQNSFQHKSVVITGATSGIGKALAIAFLQAGANVSVCGRKQATLDALQQELNHPALHTFPADVSKEADCKAFIESALAKFGKIDVLINNAGISMRALFHDAEVEVLKTLVDRLRIGPAYIPPLSLVAIIDHHIVGHILFTDIKINKKDVHALALAPLSVLPGFQNQGIGGLLIKEGLSKAAAIGYGAVIVLGHEHYYPKFGFVPASKWNIKAPFDVPDNVFMGMELFPGALDGVSGLVEYAPEFGGEP